MTNLRLGRLGFGAVITFGALSALWSCDSSSGDDSPSGTAGQMSVAGAQSVAGAPGTAGALSGTAGAPGGVSGAPGGVSGAPGSVSGAPGAGGTVGTAGQQGQAGSSSVAGSGTGGKAGATGAGGATGTAGAATGTAGAGPLPLDKITGGTQGFATRFWDCCKPSCSGSKLTCDKSNNPDNGNGSSACSGGNSFMCWSFAPFVDPANKYVAYAYAASNVGCGGCYELQFTGKSGCSDPATCPASATGLVYNTLYVQIINSGSDVKGNQFDLLIPGGGVGLFNACSNQWNSSDLGATDGGFLKGCNGDVKCTQDKCNSVFAGKPDLLAGCNWFLNWYAAGDNPQINYKKVSCPSQLSSKSGMSG